MPAAPNHSRPVRLVHADPLKRPAFHPGACGSFPDHEFEGTNNPVAATKPKPARRAAGSPDATPGVAIKQHELENRLVSLPGSTIVSLVARTVPEMRKRDNLYLGCRKVTAANGLIGWRYAASVNRRREKENQPLDEFGNLERFKSNRRKWGTRLAYSPLVIYAKPAGVFLYLELLVSSRRWHYVDEHGEPLSLADTNKLRSFLKKPDDRPDSDRQGIDNTVCLRDYAIDSIESIKMHGTEYRCCRRHPDPTPGVGRAA